MKLKPQKAADIKRMLPLLRSIAIEIQERTVAVEQLESRLASRESTRRKRPLDVGELNARLNMHRRELKRAKEELRPLGWRVMRAEAKRLLLVGASYLLDVGWDGAPQATPRKATDVPVS